LKRNFGFGIGFGFGMLRLSVSVSVSVQTKPKFRYFGFGLNSGFGRSLIGTAYNFFGRDPERTKSIVCKKVHNLVDAWNDKYIVKKEVNLKEFNLPY
jgi:hypothetical protein